MYKFNKFKAKRTLQKVKFEYKTKIKAHTKREKRLHKANAMRISYFVCSFVCNSTFVFLFQRKKNSKSFELLSIYFKMITTECRSVVVVVDMCACQADCVPSGIE